MDHYELIFLFIQFGVMLLTAIIGGQVMRWLKQPAVLGELIGGILIGPTVFGTFAPGYFNWLFPVDRSLSLARDSIISVGMLFFLFVAGLEINLGQFRSQRKQVAMTSLFGLLIPMGLGIAVVKFFPGIWGEEVLQQGRAFGIFIGTALSISALPVIARILMDLGLIQKELGMVVMTAASIDDIIGWTLFAIILNVFLPSADTESLARGQQVWTNLGLLVGYVAAVLLATKWLGRPVLLWIKRHLAWPTSFIGLTTVLMLGSAAITELLGIHAVFGAYLVGVALGQTLEPGEQIDAHEIVHQFAISFFAPLYFVSIGLRANFASNFDLPLVLLVLFVACVGKVGGASLGAWLGGMKRKEALAIGFGINARGAMEIILATVALEAGVIDERIFVALVVMALVTSVLGGPVMKRLMDKSEEEKLSLSLASPIAATETESG